MGSVKLKSRAKHIQVFQLTTTEVSGSKLIKVDHRAEVQLPGGDFGVKETTKRLPPSLTILAGQTVEVDESIAKAPSIRKALAVRPAKLVKLT